MWAALELMAVVAMALLVVEAARRDLVARRIPNWIAGAVAGLALTGLLARGPGALGLHLLTGLAVLGLGFLLWRLRFCGGGDAKLAAACAIWAGPGGLGPLLLAIAVAGGLLAVTQLALHRLGELGGLAVARLRGPAASEARPVGAARPITLPYGIAIAGGFLWWLVNIGLR
jgi:prepilin peptidase CpaA